MLENKLHEELMRYKAINKYGTTMIMEQEVPVDPALGGEVPPADPALGGEAPVDPALGGEVPPADPALGGVPEPAPGEDMGAPADPSAEGDATEEIDITDLVNMTKSIKKQMDASKDESNGAIQKMDSVFSKLSELEEQNLEAAKKRNDAEEGIKTNEQEIWFIFNNFNTCHDTCELRTIS